MYWYFFTIHFLLNCPFQCITTCVRLTQAVLVTYSKGLEILPKVPSWFRGLWINQSQINHFLLKKKGHVLDFQFERQSKFSSLFCVCFWFLAMSNLLGHICHSHALFSSEQKWSHETDWYYGYVLTRFSV